jgi:hypothetical protein
MQKICIVAFMYDEPNCSRLYAKKGLLVGSMVLISYAIYANLRHT